MLDMLAMALVAAAEHDYYCDHPKHIAIKDKMTAGQQLARCGWG
jgi:hypothetical protein